MVEVKIIGLRKYCSSLGVLHGLDIEDVGERPDFCDRARAAHAATRTGERHVQDGFIGPGE